MNVLTLAAEYDGRCAPDEEVKHTSTSRRLADLQVVNTSRRRFSGDDMYIVRRVAADMSGSSISPSR